MAANLEIFVLHPAGRVPEVQRRQMTTVLEPNVHNIASRARSTTAKTW